MTKRKDNPRNRKNQVKTTDVHFITDINCFTDLLLAELSCAADDVFV
ncbi:MAG: hypothetical protein HOG49_17815 [Candidatus Scalindua sp.]|jgi:hypothetical protein|nr:hypothetical protein [Candidatus Scalindua sp.]